MLTNGVPEHFALIMTQVDAMNMTACILATKKWIFVYRWWHDSTYYSAFPDYSVSSSSLAMTAYGGIGG